VGDNFCSTCGTPTRVGVALLNKIEKARLVLSQLERGHESGAIKQERYERLKAEYTAKLAELEVTLAQVTLLEVEETPISAPEDAKAVAAPAPAPQAQAPEMVKGVRASVIYANPRHESLVGAVKYVAAAVALAFFAFFLIFNVIGEGFETVWLDEWYLTLFSLTGPAVYLFWMWRSDKFEREPWYLLLVIVGWGAFAAFLSLIGNGLFDAVGLGAPWLSAPIVEETLKAVGVYLIASNPEFNNALDGMVYGFAAGMGFAWVENLFYITYVYEGDLFLGVLRVFVFGLGHGIYTAFTGRALGLAKEKKGYVRLGDLKSGLVLAMLCHGFYNLDLLQASDLLTLGIWMLVTLGTYTALLTYYVNRALVDQVSWGYTSGKAPSG
jgi:RsiW-degrading membrane proteinase PrsW (M82 family)